MFDDIEKFLKVPDEWAPPETKPYTPGVSILMGLLYVIFRVPYLPFFFLFIDPLFKVVGIKFT